MRQTASWGIINSPLRTGIATADPITRRDFLDLPAPVVTYFRRVLRMGEPPVRSIRVVQEGEILVGKRWRGFTASHVMSAHPPAFTWDAQVRLAPFVYATVRDTYGNGVGSVRARLAGWIPLASATGGQPLNAGALHRYLAEAAWMPAALLPRFGVRWSALSSDRAVATLTDSGTTVALEFSFDAGGEVTQIFTPGRARAIKDGYHLTPWKARFSAYEAHGGMWVPTEGVVSWQIDSNWQPCWRGRNVRIEIATDRGRGALQE